jgi:predicted aspartyl protease
MSVTGFFHSITDLRAIVRLDVNGEQKMAAMNLEIDTGAQAAMMMSQVWADYLGLTVELGHSATLADGTQRSVGMAQVMIEWCNTVHEIEAVVWPGFTDLELPPSSASGSRRYRGRPDGLVGRRLLRNCVLTIDYPNRHVMVQESKSSGA